MATDLRRDLRARLRWPFAFASADPREARCLVEDAAASPRVAEWVVRRVSGRRRAPLQLACDARRSRAVASRAGMEALLDAELRGPSAIQSTGEREPDCELGDDAEQALPSPWMVLQRLYSSVPEYTLGDEDAGVDTDRAAGIRQALLSRAADARSAHLSTLRGVIRDGGGAEGTRDRDMLVVFEYEDQTLQDVLKYNRHVLDGAGADDGPGRALADTKTRFVVFQLRDALRFLHDRGVACGGFSPSDILLTDTLWVKLGALPLASDASDAMAVEQEDPAVSIEHESTGKEGGDAHFFMDVEALSKRSLTDRWCTGDVSNFEYLMALNTAAGRRMLDSAFHPFLPWVSDFSEPMGGWRDLAKSKFRLNKGDNQLDRTYESSLVPHHVTESLSEITYYIYMSRRTPMAVLRRVVRSNFQPKEYPSTMARMYEWTPDECIPELFTDPSVFASLHGEGVMDDLSLPAWCATPSEFVRAHRAMLESAHVSACLHAWIDLNFGVALAGDEAVRQKNVPLQVQSATSQHIGKSSGFVQLFQAPHPQRRRQRNDQGAQSSLGVASVAGSVEIDCNVEELVEARPAQPTVFGAMSRQDSYQRNELKREVARMLARATQLVSDTQSDGGNSNLSYPHGDDSSRFGLANSFAANVVSQSSPPSGVVSSAAGSTTSSAPSPAGTSSSSDSKGQLMMRSFKQRKKSKARAKSSSTDAASSPTAADRGDPSGFRAPNNMSRLATVIPNFFHGDGPNASGNGTSSGAATSHNNSNGGAVASLALTIPDPANFNAVMASSPTSLSPSSSSGGELTSGPPRFLNISTPRGLGHHGGAFSGGASSSGTHQIHHTRHASLGGASPYQNSGGSHLFRDLWQQLSKPEDDGGNSIGKGAEHLAELAGFGHSHGGESLDWNDFETNELIDELDLQLLQLALPIAPPPGNAFQSQIAIRHDKKNVHPPSRSASKQVHGNANERGGGNADAGSDAHHPDMPLNQFSPAFSEDDAVIEPVYSLPSVLVEEFFPGTRDMLPLDLARAADFFSLGCTIAEIYSRTPLFSRRSIVDYLKAYADHVISQSTARAAAARQDDGWISDVAASMLGSPHSPESDTLPWNNPVVEKLTGLPFSIKHVVLALIHPDPRERLLLASVLDGDEVLSNLLVTQSQSTDMSAVLSPLSTAQLDHYTPPNSPIFPTAFTLLNQYLTQLHRARDWEHQFATTRAFLAAVAPLHPASAGTTASSPPTTLAPLHWGLLEPVLSRFFSLSRSSFSSSFTTNGRDSDTNAGVEQDGVDRVVAAIVFLLPALTRAGVVAPGATGPSIVRLEDIVRAYESAELGFILKTCLVSPDVLRSLIDAFGAAPFVDQVLPIIIEWLAAGNGLSPVAGSGSASRRLQPLFATEACSLAAVSCGELVAPSLLGSSLTIKYAAPKLLLVLGKVKAKWKKLAGSSTVRRRDTTTSVETEGMHMTMMSKLSLYEPHHVADALLQLCRELGDFFIASLLLPRVFDALPRLVQLSEAIGTVRIEGVPEELGREIYVIFRILRHVVRTFGESQGSATSPSPASHSPQQQLSTSPASTLTLQHEFFRRRPSSLVDLLAQVQPPFLHPRLASAIVAAASSTSVDASGATPTTPSASSSSSSKKKAVLRHISELKEAAARQELRAFTVVGLARTLIALCQRMGADATLAEPSLLSGVNRFLARCAEVYVDLEVSNFQWHVASELVSEFCVPLRQLLGPELFDRHVPVVANSSVLQLLLLPLGQDVASGKASNKRSSKPVMSAPDQRLTKPRRGSPTSDLKERTSASDDLDLSPLHASSAAKQALWTTSELDELVRFAHRSVRLHGVRATSFLHVPRLAQYPEDVSDALFALQQEKIQRRGAFGAHYSANALRTSQVWLRPVVARPFLSKVELAMEGESDSQSPSTGPIDRSANATAGQQPLALGASWTISGEIRDALHAHSSGVHTLAVDARERLVFSGSKKGSCRVWRVSGRPSGASGGIYTAGSVMSVASVDDGRHALAVEAACVHVWDLAKSQVSMRLPFKASGESVTSVGVMSAPASALLWSSPSSLSSAGSWSASGLTSSGDFAVATSRRVLGVDLRTPATSTRVVAEWRVDAHLGSQAPSAGISAVTAVVDASTGVLYVAVGAAGGLVTLLDPRTGRQVGKWQALDSSSGSSGHGGSGGAGTGAGGGSTGVGMGSSATSGSTSGGSGSGARVIKMAQIAPTLLLVVGSEREARVWQLRLRSQAKPVLRQVVLGIPDNVSEAQVTVQPAVADDERGGSAVLLVSSGTKLLTARLVAGKADSAVAAGGGPPVTTRAEVWQLMETPATASASSLSSLPTPSSASASTKLSKSKAVGRSVAVLPLRQLVLLGTDDGWLRCVL